jgi:hypothetical protein
VSATIDCIYRPSCRCVSRSCSMSSSVYSSSTPWLLGKASTSMRSRSPDTGAAVQPRSCARGTLLGPGPQRPRGTNLDQEQPGPLRVRQEAQSSRVALFRNYSIIRREKCRGQPEWSRLRGLDLWTEHCRRKLKRRGRRVMSRIIKLDSDLKNCPYNQPFSQQQVSNLSRRQKAAIRKERVSRVAPAARENDVRMTFTSRRNCGTAAFGLTVC